MRSKKFFDTSLFFFCLLLVCSCLSALFLDMQSLKILAFTGLLWSVLALLTTLWITERLYYFKRRIAGKNSAGLSHQILASMQEQRVYNYGMKAFRAYNPANLLIMVCGLMYILWLVWTSARPEASQALYQLNIFIEDFFRSENIDYKDTMAFLSWQALLQNVMGVLIVFLIYWLSQIYVYGNSHAANIYWLALGLFFMSFFSLLGSSEFAGLPAIPESHWTGYNWSNIDVLRALQVIPSEPLSYFQLRIYAIGMAGVTLFYMPVVVIALYLVRNCFLKSIDRRIPLSGLGVLMVLLYVDLAMGADAKQFCLWASGFCLLGVCSIRERSDIRKIYRLHQ